MTSNLGTAASETPGFGAGDQIVSSTYNRAAQVFFRPEFYNRIDAILTFNALDKETVRQIVVKDLSALNLREGMIKRNVKLGWTDEVVNHVIRLGFDSRLGARPLQRTIEKEIVTPLAIYLNDNPHLRDSKITVDCEVETGRVIVDSPKP